VEVWEEGLRSRRRDVGRVGGSAIYGKRLLISVWCIVMMTVLEISRYKRSHAVDREMKPRFNTESLTSGA
jgi:hypothetical protein